MSGRRLDAEERALWARVTQSVRPIDPRRARPAIPAVPEAEPAPARRAAPPPARPPAPAVKPVAPPPRPGTTLDAGWDKRLRQGSVAPDRVIDLHGYTVADAHDRLQQGLEEAIASGARLVLLIAGKPRPVVRGGPGVAARGTIRAKLLDWLEVSRHAGAIAAIRAAHPRHGGAGALYLVLRRPKEDRRR
ncbi:Smr/MutS family protein [Sphingomonas sanxanigenens]|uniref:Smr domain-containing protein n=1 Tax=Sphingomonas sanxanigenens DSM 19645 = NX02 TaxID=1123269 RepID=W0A5M2_9SPHN|nr:Smr/MutS family protein [Sphingomonas sanxanigenens]AHE51777.1 hypothetical protein NX02_00040 [Sphingomonas sanxanigenens DSM 19645 = NX02]